MNLVDYLGEKSYPAIVGNIVDKIKQTQPKSIRGKELVNKLYESLQTSIIPMHEIKAFTTNAEEVSKEDLTLAELLKFIKKEESGGDFNYLINLAKEEHFANMKRDGIPTPEKTIEEIKHLFDEPSNAVIEAIRNNMFDKKLNSKIYNDLRNQFNLAPETGFKKSTNKIRKLNESILLNDEGLVKYNPIAIKYMQPDKNYYITAHNVITKDGDKWQSVNIEIPEDFKALQRALQSIPYSYDKKQFQISDNWDIPLAINADGKVVTNNGTEVDKNDLQSLFIESIPFADLSKVSVDDLKSEADRFTMIANNIRKFLIVDDIDVYENDNNNFVMVDRNIIKPEVIAINNDGSKVYDTFSEMVIELNENFNYNFANTFNQQLLFEANLLKEREERKVKIQSKLEDLKKLNEATKSIYDKAEQGSLAKRKAKIELKKLNESIDKFFTELQQLSMQNKLY